MRLLIRLLMLMLLLFSNRIVPSEDTQSLFSRCVFEYYVHVSYYDRHKPYTIRTVYMIFEYYSNIRISSVVDVESLSLLYAYVHVETHSAAKSSSTGERAPVKKWLFQ